MAKLITIVGARPQFIKAAVISRLLRNTDGLDEILVHTGQHHDDNMSNIFFQEMDIPEPHYNLGIHGTFQGETTGRMLGATEAVLLKEKPDLVLVYGDTNSTLAGALAATKLHIPIAHIEAGVRSYNWQMPEEVNRIVTDRLADFRFCPSAVAVANLQREGIENNVFNVGDIMFDAALYYKNKLQPTPDCRRLLGVLGEKYYLTTLHRAENTNDESRLREILIALNHVSKHNFPIVLPLHPRTRKLIEQYRIAVPDIVICDPVGYGDMITLLRNCSAVFTDSGGLQKEAYYFQKPCLTLRDETEWQELVEEGYNRIVGADRETIIKGAADICAIEYNWKFDIYGDGTTGQQIIRLILDKML